MIHEAFLEWKYFYTRELMWDDANGRKKKNIWLHTASTRVEVHLSLRLRVVLKFASEFTRCEKWIYINVPNDTSCSFGSLFFLYFFFYFSCGSVSPCEIFIFVLADFRFGWDGWREKNERSRREATNSEDTSIWLSILPGGEPYSESKNISIPLSPSFSLSLPHVRIRLAFHARAKVKHRKYAG